MTDKLTLPLEVGKYYRARDGSKLKFVHRFRGDVQNPCLFVDEEEGYSWRAADPAGTPINDLNRWIIVADWVEPRIQEVWLNMYPDRQPRVWLSRKAADDVALNERIACERIACIKVTLTEGQWDE